MGNNGYELNLQSDAFNAFKSDFNKMLRQILLAMESKEAEEGTMTIKFGITLSKESVPDFGAPYPDAQRDIVNPAFEHKITSQITLKASTDGILKGQYELVWDKDANEYVIRPIDNGQMHMDDIVHQGADADVDSEGFLLTPPSPAELPPASLPEADTDYAYEPPSLGE